jgi:hypothetical protein
MRGLGFGVTRRDDKTFVGHGGSCPGYRSQLDLQLDDKIATIAMANAMVDAGLFTRRAYEIVAPAIEAATGVTEDEGAEREAGPVKEMPGELQKYVGIYDSFPWGGESQIIPWKGGLASVSFPTDDPLEGLVRLKHVEGHIFRRIRSDETLGEEWIFDVNEEGEVIRRWVHGNASPKIG